jgi:transcriptional regulator with XRE-family HTH domain
MPLTSRQIRQLRSATGNRLRAARTLAGLRQVDVASQLGMSQSRLSDLERQRWASASLDTARRFAEYFGCAIEDLFPAREERVAS